MAYPQSQRYSPSWANRETKWPNGPGVGNRTLRNLQRLKDEAGED